MSFDQNKSSYVGRFAPSPTGHLHFGSLVSAAASYLDARANQGRWLVRIEDIDETRCHSEYEQSILNTLTRFGFLWQQPVFIQSQRKAIYQAAFDKLFNQGLVYGCACSRKQLAVGSKGIDGAPVYVGTCAQGLPAGKTARSWRMRVTHEPIVVDDLIQGRQTQDLAHDVGDFVLKRADGLFAYQLAVVVDDIEQGVNHIVRGADLLDSTPRQIWLYQCLNAKIPVYAHVPLAVNINGEKLSKQTLAASVNQWPVVPTLLEVFSFLNLPVEQAPRELSLLWSWAIKNWQLSKLARNRVQKVSQTFLGSEYAIEQTIKK